MASNVTRSQGRRLQEFVSEGDKRGFRPQRGAPDGVWVQSPQKPEKRAEHSIECDKFSTG